MIVPSNELGISRAAAALRDGKLVAFPTETVYGLGARADDDAAVARIYAAKGRPAENPSIVHTASIEAALALAEDPGAAASLLAASFWPGPLTLVLRARRGAVSPIVTAGGATVALRVPSHPVALALLTEVGVAVAAPSANRSTLLSPTTAAHVEKSFRGREHEILIVDGGPTGFGIESTIVDVTVEPAVILRRGSISLEQIRAHVDAVDLGGTVVALADKPRAPGLTAKHYAPRVPLALVDGAEIAGRPAHRAAFLILEGTAAPGGAEAVEVMPRDPVVYARRMYAALHALEERDVDRITVERVPEDEAWAAVRDRLGRAASTSGR